MMVTCAERLAADGVTWLHQRGALATERRRLLVDACLG